MKRKGALQFEHIAGPSNFTGFAVDMERGEVVAQAQITRPHASIEEGVEAYEEPSGQLRLPIHTERPRVSWAVANRAGRAAAAPHMLLAALSEEHGLRPTADSSLSEEGARMTKSAVKRGLIEPHPSNPKLEAKVGYLYPSHPEEREKSINSGMLGAYEAAYMGMAGFGYGPRTSMSRRVNAMDKFSPEQMGRAAQRVFGGNKKRQREREPAPEQGTLF